ncbi:MAG: phosphate acyltransferase [Betaproteobacteria bacterium TMED82]|nr:MAG: phosphate acyltransferase [Betaproteobacteria bacterium TMED82]|tara:strand:+ start:10606 stop:11655 length:1050 start_codon:yes stop_codon:yes gene_type:complete
MTNCIHVAIDVMGGDFGPSETVSASVDFLLENPGHKILLVGEKECIGESLSLFPKQTLDFAHLNLNCSDSRLSVLHTEEKIKMDESPALALKRGRKSSMWLAVDAVKRGQCSAAVSAGNTGALMAISKYLLKMLEGIDRPAIASSLPNISGGSTTVLDLGANVECNEYQLLQFAMMGSALVSATHLIKDPTIGLLNVGEEMIKGNDVVKKVGELLTNSNLNFVGNVEGDDIFKGKSDVVVCDGFVGNVALKSSEGLAQMIRNILKEEFNRNLITKILSFCAFPVLKKFSQRLDHRRYNGAALLGLNGIIFKSHGSADRLAFRCAIERAVDAASNQVNDRIKNILRASEC